MVQYLRMTNLTVKIVVLTQILTLGIGFMIIVLISHMFIVDNVLINKYEGRGK